MTQLGLLSQQQPQGLLGYDPKQAALWSLISGLGNTSSSLLAAGAASTDPGNFGRNIANLGRDFTEGFRSNMDRTRNHAMQDYQTRLHMDQVARQQKQDMARERYTNAAAMGGKDMAGRPVDMRGLLTAAYPEEVAKAQIPGLIGVQKPIEVSPGASLYDPQTRQALYTAPKADAPTALQRNLRDAGMVPGTKPYQEAILASLNKPGVSVNLGNNDKTNPKVWDVYDAAYQSYDKRADNLRGLEQMARLVPHVDSGFGAETLLEGRKALASLGFDVDMSNVANAEQFRTLAMDRVMERIAGTKGAISEKEMSAFEKASPSLANTPQGNALILKAAIEAERRGALVDDFVMRTVQQNPDIGRFQLDRMVREFREDLAAQPVFTPEEMQMIEGVRSASAPQGNAGQSKPRRFIRNPKTGRIEAAPETPQGYSNPLTEGGAANRIDRLR